MSGEREGVPRSANALGIVSKGRGETGQKRKKGGEVEK